jgi:hypothetical protein
MSARIAYDAPDKTGFRWPDQARCEAIERGFADRHLARFYMEAYAHPPISSPAAGAREMVPRIHAVRGPRLRPPAGVEAPWRRRRAISCANTRRLSAGRSSRSSRRCRSTRSGKGRGCDLPRTCPVPSSRRRKLLAVRSAGFGTSSRCRTSAIFGRARRKMFDDLAIHQIREAMRCRSNSSRPSAGRRTPYWTIRGTYLGRYVERSTRTGDRRVAARMLADEKAKIERDAISGAQPVGKTFAGAAAAYMHATGVTRFMKPLLLHFRDADLASIDQEAIDSAAVAILPHGTAATRNRQVYTPVSAVLRHAGTVIALRRPQGRSGARSGPLAMAGAGCAARRRRQSLR